ncbi:MAG: HD-GYP domain-containing protein [Candidatus Abyssobacteria bacterium SURF_5]|uniref:HD-GYP domain-containing protein n=1 Tax=Abyssobacteria bacterium (strain SURF_5) TaxID=2093360 RepID=A0A3A4NRZ2_ABYX5|nr:MAG: HD-GYP domain-containing protein [Candidatus Abyssubacteria bacterium SURF_5]
MIEHHAGAPEIIARIAAVARNVGVYPPKHPMVLQSAEDLMKLIRSTPAGSARVTAHMVNSELYFEKEMLPDETIKHSFLVQFLKERGINSISINRDAEPEAIANFFAVLAAEKQKNPDKRELRKNLEEKKISGVEFDNLLAVDLMEKAYDLSETETGEAASQSYQGAVECLKAVEQDVAAESPGIDKEALQKIVSSLLEEFLGDRNARMGIMSMKNYDQLLFHHSVNVAVTALLIARKLPLSAECINAIGVSALLHDIGKLKIPREIAANPGRLTDAEWNIIRRHPIEGAQMLMRYEGLGDLPVLAAFEHHAGYDLSGYPPVKGKSHPHAVARIIGIADAYEAMTASRPYRPAQTLDYAVKVLLHGSGTHFDPLLVKLFLSIIGVFPPGSLVRLQNGAAAVVIEPGQDNPFFPKVRLLDRLSSDSDAPLVDTAENPSEYSVVGVADSDNI